ncbi:MAG: hypothetical protein RL318_1370 [Fibrobacterota bacterium]|jgi:hypothetical protein
MRKPSILSASLAALVLSLSACDGDGDATGTSGNGTNGDWDTTYSVAYRKLNDTLFVTAGDTEKVHITRQCRLDRSVTPATVKLFVDSAQVSHQDDTMSVHASATTLLVYGYTRTLPSGTTYVTRSMYDRVGTGTGYLGTWNPAARDSIRAMNGPDDDTAILRMRAESAKWESQLKSIGSLTQIQFTNEAIVIRLKFGPAARLIACYWERYSADYYTITATATSDNSLTYTSTKTGEVVTATVTANGAIAYSSTNPKRAPYTEINNPTTVSQCPTDPWFDTFQSENSNWQAFGRVSGIVTSSRPVFLRNPTRF